jgi:CRP/FNR family transcriptional regulator, cyclic AMP receptor protein
MSLSPRGQLLQTITLLAALPDAALEPLAKSCRWKDYAAGSDILAYLDTSTDVHFLVQGRARVVVHSAQGKAVIFSDLAAGETFGELAAVDGKPRTASVSALQPSTIATLPASTFLRLMADHPDLTMAVVRSLVAHIRRLDERVLEFSVLNVPGRIQAELLRFGEEAAVPGQDNVMLTPGPSLADLANRISTHREAVSRELSRLTNMGVLKRESGGLRITSLARLGQMVHDAKGD